MRRAFSSADDAEPFFSLLLLSFDFFPLTFLGRAGAPFSSTDSL